MRAFGSGHSRGVFFTATPVASHLGSGGIAKLALP